MTDQTLTIYLAQDRRTALARKSTLPKRSTGAALFADISGFTPLTEALTNALGPRRGIEELTAQINRVYAALITEIERYGGSVVDFAGDAVTCWFDQQTHLASADQPLTSDPAGPLDSVLASSASVRAVACALALQGAMGTFAAVPLPQGGTVPLALKVAVASGPVSRFIVGDANYHFIDALAGATVTRTAIGESLAQKGEVIIDWATAKQLGDWVRIDEWRTPTGATSDAYGVVSSLLLAATPAPWPHDIVLDEANARAWLIPAVYERLHDGLGEFLTELRPAVALFLRFDGIDYDTDDEAEQKLDRFIRHVQEVGARYGGTLLQLTIGDKGSYCYMAFGAPSANEDDARRAVSAALELRMLPSELPFLQPVQIGISLGVMRSGAYGGTTRRAYSVLGDEVNLAARLMQKAAPGEVLVSGRVREKVSAAFEWDILPAIAVKGKREPIPLARLMGAQTQRPMLLAYRGVLVGREAELARLQRLVRPIYSGRFAGVVYVYGEAGMGKSRLVEQLRRILTSAPDTGDSKRSTAAHTATWLSLPADQILRQSLNPFYNFLRNHFDQNPNASPEHNSTRFNTILNELIAVVQTKQQRAPRRSAHTHQQAAQQQDAQSALASELERTRSFLAAMIDLRQEGSLYEQLEPKLRFENTLAALKALFLAESIRQPLAIQIEDAQWLDDDSLTMLQSLTRNVSSYPLVVLVTSRYRDDGSSVKLALDAEVPQQSLELRALTAAGVRAVAAQTLGGPVADPLASFLAEKTNGNPFFVEQLILDLRERSLITSQPSASDDQPAQWSLIASQATMIEVPDTINAVLIARLDRLAAQVKAVVQTAAVLGQEFEIQLLSGMLRDDPQLPDRLRQGERETIWTALNELRYLFRHALLRDAAYSMQLRARLRELHLLAGELIETIHTADVAAHAADLAYHYGRAEHVPQERRYARMAGDYAAARYANSDAATFYSRALELTPAADGVARYTLLLAREQIYDLQGAREAQRSDLSALTLLAEQLDDPERRVEIALRQARYADLTGDYPAMIAAAQQAILLTEQSRTASGQAAGYLHWARALWYQGDYAGVQVQATQALQIAQANRAAQLEADSLRILGNAAMSQGNYAEARAAYEPALHIQQALGDRRAASGTRNNLGIIAWYQGNYAEAQAAYAYDLQIKREMGDRYGQSLALLNLGEVAAVQGDYLAAQSFYAEALQLKRETGDRYGQSVVLANLGDSAALLGDTANAQTLYEQALNLAQALGHQQQSGWVHARLGLLLHQQGQHTAGLEQSTLVLQIAQAINDRNTQGYALTLHGHVLAALGRTAEAQLAYQQALELRQTLEQYSQAAEPLAGLAQLAFEQRDLAQASAHVASILQHLQSSTLDGTDEPFRVYLTCYRILRATSDPQAEPLREQARSLLRERAAHLNDQARHIFLESIATHRELIAGE